jgi:hypothetical protein
MVNGYPNFWGWGNEDNCLQTRCLKFGIQIDRSVFYPIGSPEILQLFDGISRIISKRDYAKVKADKGYDGIKTIHQLRYTIDKKSSNIQDNIFVLEKENDAIQIINITHFLTATPYESEEYYEYDLREPVKKIVQPDKTRKTTQTFTTTEDWQKIPYYPTLAERKQMASQNQSHSKSENARITPSYLYSPQYAKQNGIKSRATTSIGIKLGGLKHHI